jgi:hypothetical protein
LAAASTTTDDDGRAPVIVVEQVSIVWISISAEKFLEQTSILVILVRVSPGYKEVCRKMLLWTIHWLWKSLKGKYRLCTQNYFKNCDPCFMDKIRKKLHPKMFFLGLTPLEGHLSYLPTYNYIF